MNRKLKFLNGLFLLVSIYIISCNHNGNEQHFSLKTLSPYVLKKNGAEIFQYWEFKNAPFVWDTNFVQPTGIKLYIDSLSKILGKDTVKLIIQDIAFQDTSYKSVKTENGDSINAQLIHSKTLGKIRPINYLESQLLDYQLSRYPLLSHPTEFHGFILSHDSLNLVKVYFAASDQPWPPKPGVILQALKTDLKQGWAFKFHLHNHYEPKTKNYLGILAPSMTDAQYYMFLSEEYNLEQSLITNGFHTVEIKRSEFQKFRLPNNN
ncbi:MAG: hypothetical protein ACK5C0_02070 [Candidatus Kapaibacterium sp.]|jgi:hypothetical protein